MGRYRYGQIVRAWVLRHDQWKRRPVVIITPDEDVVPGEDLFAVCISSSPESLAPPLQSHHILLPWDRRGHPKTGLVKACAAICNWQIMLPEAHIIEHMGHVPNKQLEKIANSLAALDVGNAPSE